MTLQYWLLFYGLVFLFLLKVYCFEKWKILGRKSPRSHFSITPATFRKMPQKEPLSQTLVCCCIMALLFLERLSYCSCFQYFFNPALLGLVENIFELIVIGLTSLLILYMDVNSNVSSVVKVGFRAQINYIKFMKVCVLVLQKQVSISLILQSNLLNVRPYQ